jgi:hypothetical protein
LSEIEFLTLYAKPDKKWTVVYAGSAQGTHILYLSELFPNVTFHLYDPSKFDNNLVNYAKTHENIKIFNELFLNETCQQYKNKEDVFFISDIRTVPSDTETMHERDEDGDTTSDADEASAEFEKEVSKNMAWQKEWVEIMQPVASMLKFRLPYKPGKTKYLDGKIYFQVWAGKTSSEGRLISEKPYRIIEYDNTDYEQCMFRLNLCDRAMDMGDEIEFRQPAPVINNYDVLAEEHILKEYIKTFKDSAGFPHPKDVPEMHKDISISLGQELKDRYINRKNIEFDVVLGNNK